jgi:hypothetical protein
MRHSESADSSSSTWTEFPSTNFISGIKSLKKLGTLKPHGTSNINGTNAKKKPKKKTAQEKKSPKMPKRKKPSRRFLLLSSSVSTKTFPSGDTFANRKLKKN